MVTQFRPTTPRRTALAPLLAVGLALSCAGQPDADSQGQSELEGELVVHVVDFGDHSETVYGLRLDGGPARALTLPSPTTLSSGTRVRVRGTDDGRAIQATALIPLSEGAFARALVTGTKKRDRNWAFVLVDTGGGVNLSKAEAEKILFSPDKTSIRGYYEEVSYGLQTIKGQVFGPFKVQVQGSVCDVNTSAMQIIDQAGKQITEKFDQYLWYIGSKIGNCPWNGAAEQGRAARPTQDSFYNASTRCSTLAQEPGHNFGMVHSSALVCRDGATGVSLPGPMGGGCAHVEYGNPMDPMGSGCGHMNGLQKAYQGWLEGCNAVKVTKSGTFTLFPLEEPCNGVQLLQVPTPTRQFRYSGAQAGVISSFYLELRTPVGLDATAIGQGDLGDGRPVPLGVYVVMGADLRGVSQEGNPNWLLDMTPGSRGAAPTRDDLNDGALPVGKPFRDPIMGGPTITVISADRTKAVVKVELAGGMAEGDGEGLCFDGQLFRGPGPINCAAPPQLAGDAGAASPDSGSSTPTADAGAEPAPPDAAPAGKDAGAASGGKAGAGGQAGGSGGTGGEDPGDDPGPVKAASSGCSYGSGPAGSGLAPLALLLAAFRRRRRH
jgi:MYXO-CTERM domain-containing protein